MLKAFWPMSSLFILTSVSGQGVNSERGFCETYTVNPGESALTISQKFGIDYEIFVSTLNDCMGFEEGNVLQIGERVCLPPYPPGCDFVTITAENNRCKYYTVQYGDTLSTIANSFKIDVAEFATLNGFNLTTPVEPLVNLALPPWDENCPQNILQKPPQSSPGTECKIYISNGGETLTQIALSQSVEESELIYYNSEYQSDQVTQPGDQIKLTPWSEHCSDKAIVVNKP